MVEPGSKIEKICVMVVRIAYGIWITIGIKDTENICNDLRLKRQKTEIWDRRILGYIEMDLKWNSFASNNKKNKPYCHHKTPLMVPSIGFIRRASNQRVSNFKNWSKNKIWAPRAHWCLKGLKRAHWG